MREFEWTLDGEVLAVGYVDFDGSAQLTVNGLAPIGFVSVEAMQERVAALPLDFVMNWVVAA